MAFGVNPKEKKAWIDLAKVVGILAIVLGHALQGGMIQKYVYSFHVPLFFFLSGAVFKVKEKRFGEFAAQKAKRLLIPYVLFACISIFIYMCIGRVASDIIGTRDNIGGVGEEIKNMFLGYVRTNSPLWYLPSLFIMLLIAFPVVRILEKIQNKKRKWVLTMGIVLLSVGWLIISRRVLHLYQLPWKLELVFHMFAFFMLGYSLSHFGIAHRMENMLAAGKVTMAVVSLAAGFCLAMMNERVQYVGEYYGNECVYFLSAISSVLGIVAVSMLIPEKTAVSHIARRTIAILVMHKFPVLFFQMIPITRNALKAGSFVAGLAVSSISIAMCLFAEEIINRVRPGLLR